jgi:DNA repair exonuclease SbcCD nuclease subunit
MFRFLHLADVHLDTRFLGRSSALRQLLRDSQFKAFKRAINLALSEKVDAVLIAGDLFDNERLSFATERFLLEQIHRLFDAGIPSVYATGNHDPGAKNCRAQSIEWPPNFHLVGNPQPEIIELADSDGNPVARVVGAGHDSPSEGRNLVRDFSMDQGWDVPVVGLLHTYVTTAKSAEQHDRYAPCSIQDLESRDYAYWALGHVHAQQRVAEVDAWYPGILQGRHPGETGSKGGLMVTIPDRDSPCVEFRSLSSAVWETLKLDQLSQVRNLADLRRMAIAAFAEKREENPTVEDWMLRLSLEGPCPLTDVLQDGSEIETLEDDLKIHLEARFVEVRTRRLTPNCDIDSFRGELHVLSEILALIEEAQEDEKLLEELSPHVLAGSTDESSDTQVYLRELITGLDYEAVSRLVESTDAH